MLLLEKILDWSQVTKIFRKVGTFLKYESFKEALAEDVANPNKIENIEISNRFLRIISFAGE